MSTRRAFIKALPGEGVAASVAGSVIWGERAAWARDDRTSSAFADHVHLQGKPPSPSPTTGTSRSSARPRSPVNDRRGAGGRVPIEQGVA